MVDMRTSFEAINFSFEVITTSIKDSPFSVTLVGLLINCIPSIITSRPNKRDSMTLSARSSMKFYGVLGGRYAVQMTNDL